MKPFSKLIIAGLVFEAYRHGPGGGRVVVRDRGHSPSWECLTLNPASIRCLADWLDSAYAPCAGREAPFSTIDLSHGEVLAVLQALRMLVTPFTPLAPDILKMVQDAVVTLVFHGTPPPGEDGIRRVVERLVAFAVR